MGFGYARIVGANCHCDMGVILDAVLDNLGKPTYQTAEVIADIEASLLRISGHGISI